MTPEHIRVHIGNALDMGYEDLSREEGKNRENQV